jgi:hypothetical protein
VDGCKYYENFFGGLDRMNAEQPTANSDPSEATAFHEAGHAVMALLLGRSIHKISIIPGHIQTGGMRLGQCEFKKSRSKPSGDAIEDEILILLSGMVAESLVTDGYCCQGAARDLSLARSLIGKRASSEKEADRLERRLLNKTEYLLGASTAVKAIELIAAELLKEKTVSGRAAQYLFDVAQRT